MYNYTFGFTNCISLFREPDLGDMPDTGATAGPGKTSSLWVLGQVDNNRTKPGRIGHTGINPYPHCLHVWDLNVTTVCGPPVAHMEKRDDTSPTYSGTF